MAERRHDSGLLVIGDTTPFLYLARLGILNVLSTLYERVIVPGRVWSELVEARPDAVGVAAIRSSPWIEVDRSVDGSVLALGLSEALEAGEAAAIALALARRADLLLIDDLDGRRAALARGLVIRGTVGILVAGRRAGIIPALRPLLDALVAERFRIDAELYREVLADVGESPE